MGWRWQGTVTAFLGGDFHQLWIWFLFSNLSNTWRTNYPQIWGNVAFWSKIVTGLFSSFGTSDWAWAALFKVFLLHPPCVVTSVCQARDLLHLISGKNEMEKRKKNKRGHRDRKDGQGLISNWYLLCPPSPCPLNPRKKPQHMVLALRIQSVRESAILCWWNTFLFTHPAKKKIWCF